MIQENAYQLLDNGMVHVIANDVHRPNGKRSVNLQETYEVLRQKNNQAEDLTRLMYDNPLAIINGHAPELIKVRKISKLPWFKRRK